ncbi:hypothetical protein T492DRAFT_892611 [Pavlovales sp. CCMP2436]|nr:hypothetical protein T492DRAFT_892611 [Pavlovales sp. CCMP2436]
MRPVNFAIARLEAAAGAALPPGLRALAVNPLRVILKLLIGVDLTCARLAYRDFRNHSSPAQEAMRRSDFLCTRALVELVDHRQCALAADACMAAAKNGQLDALIWLRSRGSPWDSNTSWCAAAGGHLEVLQYAHEHDCPWDSVTCEVAAHGGHLEVLRYAHEHECPWNSDTSLSAAVGGHVEVLRYAHEHDCLWDNSTCSQAALGGHLEVLRYAHEHGCPIDVNEQSSGCEARALSRAPENSPARRATFLASCHAGYNVSTGQRASAMSAGVQLSAPLLAKARETRCTKSISARLMTLHAQLTEAWYSAIGALLAVEAEAQALAE